MYGERQEPQETIVEGAQSRIGAAFPGLYLEQPYGSIDSDSYRSGVGLIELDGIFGEGDALPRSDLLVDAGCVLASATESALSKITTDP